MSKISFIFFFLIILGGFVISPPKSVYAVSNFCLRVPVLMYHHIQPQKIAIQKKQTGLTVDSEIFSKQLAYLSSKGYQTLNAKTLIDALINHQPLPPKSVVITIDDGYSDAYTYAYPIAQKYRTTLNLMIPTGLLNNPEYLSWDQLKSMTGSGLVFAHNHTWSHAYLPKLNDKDVDFEIKTATQQLLDQTGQNSHIMAYPYGANSPSVISYLQHHDFQAAFTTLPGTVSCSSNIFRLPRVRVGNGDISRYGI